MTLQLSDDCNPSRSGVDDPDLDGSLEMHELSSSSMRERDRSDSG